MQYPSSYGLLTIQRSRRQWKLMSNKCTISIMFNGLLRFAHAVFTLLDIHRTFQLGVDALVLFDCHLCLRGITSSSI